MLFVSDVHGLPSRFGSSGSVLSSSLGASFGRASSDLVTSSPDLSASLLSSSFIERHQLEFPIVAEVVEEIDFDLKEEVGLFISSCFII